jgi:carbamoyltransferase
MRAHPPQQNQLFRGTRYLAKCLREHFGVQKLPPIYGVGHHHSHAAAYYMSPFDEATVLVMDGYGDDASTSIYTGRGRELTRHWKTNLFNSLGILYTVVTKHLGFQANQDEGKVMGLAAYGTPAYVDAFRKLVKLLPGGRYQVDMSYFDYDKYGLARPFRKKFFDTFGASRHPESELTQHHRDLAFGLQALAEDVILHVVRQMREDFPSPNLVLSGGVALNCVANARILVETDYESIWIPPNASDTGATLGSALWHYHQQLGHERRFSLKHASYGKAYDDAVIERALRDHGMEFTRLPEDEMLQRVAADLAEGRIVGWFQGRFEMGPRALGNRSILADPRRADMKDTLNRRVKHRESFRPFAPAVLLERVHEWFEIDQADPFMTIAPRVRREKAHIIPAGVHADKTGRIQTVEREANPRYWGVIREFEKLTGVPIVLNTSFNRQEPIVATPEQAISCFLRTDMDVLVLGNYYTRDHNQKSVDLATQRFIENGHVTTGRSVRAPHLASSGKRAHGWQSVPTDDGAAG